MIKISVDESAAFDILSIHLIKEGKSKNPIQATALVQSEIQNQIGNDKYQQIFVSKEFDYLKQANKEIFAAIDDVKNGIRKPAAYLDYLNWLRYFYKCNLQSVHFRSGLTEIKLGYDWCCLSARDSIFLVLVDEQDYGKFIADPIYLSPDNVPFSGTGSIESHFKNILNIKNLIFRNGNWFDFRRQNLIEANNFRLNPGERRRISRNRKKEKRRLANEKRAKIKAFNEERRLINLTNKNKNGNWKPNELYRPVDTRYKNPEPNGNVSFPERPAPNISERDIENFKNNPKHDKIYHQVSKLRK